MAYQAPDYGGYERQKADVNYKYSNDAVTNAYGRFISQQRGNRSLGDMSRGFGRQTPTFNSQFGARGLAGGGINSGTMQNAMQQRYNDYGRQYGRAQQDLTQNLQQYDMNQNRLDAWRQQSLDAIEAQKANDIANSAENILYLQQLLGGLG